MIENLARHKTAIGAGLALAVVGASALAMTFVGIALGLLVLAGSVLLLVVGLLWSSVQNLTGEAPLTLEDAMGLAAPRAEEEQKRAVLRALKDLEYERSVGKISEEDYTELSARYRQQAKELLRALDADLAPARARVERLVEKRLGRAPAAAPDKPKKASVRQAVKARACTKCDVRNELDARFCKACAAPLAADGEVLCAACPARYAEDLEACPDCGVAKAEAS